VPLPLTCTSSIIVEERSPILWETTQCHQAWTPSPTTGSAAAKVIAGAVQ
jgi:hypothetical protein